MSDRNPVLCIPKHLTEDISDGRHWRLVKWEIVPVTVSMAEQLELVELTTRDTDSAAERLRERVAHLEKALLNIADWRECATQCDKENGVKEAREFTDADWETVETYAAEALEPMEASNG